MLILALVPHLSLQQVAEIISRDNLIKGRSWGNVVWQQQVAVAGNLAQSELQSEGSSNLEARSSRRLASQFNRLSRGDGLIVFATSYLLDENNKRWKPFELTLRNDDNCLVIAELVRRQHHRPMDLELAAPPPGPGL